MLKTNLIFRLLLATKQRCTCQELYRLTMPGNEYENSQVIAWCSCENICDWLILPSQGPKQWQPWCSWCP